MVNASPAIAAIGEWLHHFGERRRYASQRRRASGSNVVRLLPNKVCGNG